MFGLLAQQRKKACAQVTKCADCPHYFSLHGHAGTCQHSESRVFEPDDPQTIPDKCALPLLDGSDTERIVGKLVVDCWSDCPFYRTIGFAALGRSVRGIRSEECCAHPERPKRRRFRLSNADDWFREHILKKGRRGIIQHWCPLPDAQPGDHLVQPWRPW